MTKIGILLIHGIGDQQRYKHLHDFTEFMASGLSELYGKKQIAIEAPGVRTPKGQSPVSILVTTNQDALGPTERFDLYECWWRDLAQQPRLTAILRFWLWASTLAGTRGLFCNETVNRANPRDNHLSFRKNIGLRYRLVLFFKPGYIFLLLAPAALVFNLLRVIPGVGHIPFIRAVFTYLSSVQLYQETEGKITGELTDFDNARRVSIQRRLANLMITLHESDCDYWFIIAHSLGSVIGFKGIMYDGRAFARLVSHDRWHHPAVADLRCKEEGSDYHDLPKLPIWLLKDDALQVDVILSKLRGFATHGSPLETFARTWPGIVQIRSKVSEALAPSDFETSKRAIPFEWLNIYDPSDLIASKLTSFSGRFNKDLSGICPVEIPIRSSINVASSHVKYFHGRPIFKDIIRWMEDGDKSFGEIRSTTDLSSSRIVLRRLAIVVQLVALFIVGGFIWPFSAFAVISTVQFAVNRLIYYLVDALNLFTDRIWGLGIIGNDLRTKDNEAFCRLPDQELQFHVDLAECADEELTAAKKFIQGLSPDHNILVSVRHVLTIFIIVALSLAIVTFARWAFEWIVNVIRSRRGQNDNSVRAAVLGQNLGESE